MRILHTADWHVGNELLGIDRQEETGKLLDELYEAAVRESVDLLLVAGDLFDNPLPPSWATKMVYDFFSRLAQTGIRSLVLAGNHDGKTLEPPKNLLALGRVTVYEKPAEDAVLRFRSRRDEPVVVIALPYPHERLLMDLKTAGDDLRGQYIERVSQLLRYLSRHADIDALNVFTSHLMIAGARISETERPGTVIPFFSIPPQNLPHNVHYVALGHVHRHQQVVQAPAQTFYAGSLFRLNFGETGIEKGFYLVEIERIRTDAQFIPLQSALPLWTVTATQDEVWQALEPYAHRPGYVRLQLRVETESEGLVPEIRGRYPNVIKVDIQRPEETRADRPQLDSLADTSLQAVEVIYRRFRPEAGEEVLKVIEQLYEEVTGAHPAA